MEQDLNSKCSCGSGKKYKNCYCFKKLFPPNAKIINWDGSDKTLTPGNLSNLVFGVDMIFEFVHKRWNNKSDRIKLLEQVTTQLNRIRFNEGVQFTNPIGKYIVNPFKVKTDSIGRLVIKSMFPEVEITMVEMVAGFDAFREIANDFIKIFNKQQYDFGVEYFGTEVYMKKMDWSKKYISIGN